MTGRWWHDATHRVPRLHSQEGPLGDNSTSSPTEPPASSTSFLSSPADAGWVGGPEPPGATAGAHPRARKQGQPLPEPDPLRGEEHSDGADRTVGTARPPTRVPTPSDGSHQCPTRPLSCPASSPTGTAAAFFLACPAGCSPLQKPTPPPTPWLHSGLPSPGTPAPAPAHPLKPADHVQLPSFREPEPSLPPRPLPGSEASSGSPSPCQQAPHVPQTDPTQGWKPTRASLLSFPERKVVSGHSGCSAVVAPPPSPRRCEFGGGKPPGPARILVQDAAERESAPRPSLHAAEARPLGHVQSRPCFHISKACQVCAHPRGAG